MTRTLAETVAVSHRQVDRPARHRAEAADEVRAEQGRVQHPPRRRLPVKRSGRGRLGPGRHDGYGADLPENQAGFFYPFEMVRAITLTWLFSGQRSDEITRLRAGCIRWQHEDAPIARGLAAGPGP